MARRPSVSPAAPWRFPQPRPSRLANGVAVDLFDLPGQRVVTASVLVDAPLAGEPRPHEGVAALAMRACDEGTLTHPGADLTDALEGCGAVTANAGAGLDGATLTVEAPATRLAEALPLVAELLTEPAFAADDVARLVQDRLLGIAVGEVSPPVRATKALHALLGDHRWARPFGGDAESVAGLTPGIVRAWHSLAVRPDRTRLLVAGELPAGIEHVIDAHFGAWRHVGDAPVEPVPPPVHMTPQVVVVDRPDAAQVSLRIGAVTPTRTHADWPALQVANAVVGAMFGSRLNGLLREERGLTYGAGSGLSAARRDALFVAQAECAPEAAAEATRLALDVLDVAAAPITTKEARDAIAFITAATPLRLATADAVAAQAANFALGGVGYDWFNGYMEAVAGVSADEATRAFARWIQPDGVGVALCGPATTLVPRLRAAGLSAEVVG